jgi:hypothetical protein
VGLDRGVEVNLHKSVLLESEVLLMVGAAPTSRVITADGMTATENLRASKGEEFELRFLFISSEKAFLLSGIQSSEVPEELFDSALTVIANSSEMAREACDILKLLPVHQSVVSWLGPPLMRLLAATMRVLMCRQEPCE